MISSTNRKLGVRDASNDMIDVAKDIWKKLDIDMNLSDQEETTCKAAFQNLFNRRIQRCSIEDSVQQLLRVLKNSIKDKWENALPEYDVKSILALAKSEGADKDNIATEWIVQKTIVGLMEDQFMLQNVDEFDAANDRRGYIIFSRNGSIVIAEGLRRENVPNIDDSGEVVGIIRNAPMRDCSYIRIPSRRTGEWTSAIEGRGVSDEFLKIGERGRTPIINTSDVIQILVIPENQLGNMELIVRTSRAAASTLMR